MTPGRLSQQRSSTAFWKVLRGNKLLRMKPIPSIVVRQSLTSTLELTPVHGNHRLELRVLGAYSLGTTEADIGEQFVKQHNRALLSRDLTLTVCCNH